MYMAQVYLVYTTMTLHSPGGPGGSWPGGPGGGCMPDGGSVPGGPGGPGCMGARTGAKISEKKIKIL